MSENTGTDHTRGESCCTGGRPFVVGGTIQFPLFGTICDPGDPCYREPNGDNDQE